MIEIIATPHLENGWGQEKLQPGYINVTLVTAAFAKQVENNEVKLSQVGRGEESWQKHYNHQYNTNKEFQAGRHGSFLPEF